MKKKKNLSLPLNKTKISELTRISQRRVLGGGQSYGGGSYCGCGGGPTGSLSCSGHACG